MDATMEIEQARDAGHNLAQVVESFSVWRASRKAGGRIAPELWSVAVDMAKVHGLYRISKELGLDYCGLKRRLEGPGGDVQGGRGDTRFVELVATQASRTACLRDCVIELHNPSRHRRSGAGLQTAPGGGPLQRGTVRLRQPQAHGHQDFGL